MKLLLTGAGGFLGTAVLQRLEPLPLQVRALYRSSMPAPAFDVEFMQGDLESVETCERACAGQNMVLHLAGQAHVQGSHINHHEHTFGITRNLAQAAIKQGVSTFIHISSTKANFPSHSQYAKAKSDSEDFLLAQHREGRLKVVCLRPALIYGPGMKGNLAILLKLLQWQVLPLFPSSSQPIGMISLADCSRAIVASLEQEALIGRCWELNDGQQYSLDLLVQQVRFHLEYSMPWLRLPRFPVKLAACSAQLGSWATGKQLGSGSFRALYEEPYKLDDEFARATGFKAQQTFHSELPALLTESRQ
jgi:UDP-glucose 4-epimerase